MYLVLNFINVDAVIAKNNIDRFLANPEKEIDFYYLMASTGVDAIPEMKRLLNVDNAEIKENICDYLGTMKAFLKSDDSWMEFNISRRKARECLKNIEEKEYDYESYR